MSANSKKKGVCVCVIYTVYNNRTNTQSHNRVKCKNQRLQSESGNIASLIGHGNSVVNKYIIINCTDLTAEAIRELMPDTDNFTFSLKPTLQNRKLAIYVCACV